MKRFFELYGRTMGILLMLCVLQLTFIKLIAIDTVTPDFVLIGVILVGLRRGREPAMIAGFVAGLFLDLIMGEVVGLSALSKTVAGFLTGFLYVEDRAELSLRSLTSVRRSVLVIVVHQTVFLFSYYRDVSLPFFRLFALHGIGGTLYTLVFMAVFILITSRMPRRIAIH